MKNALKYITLPLVGLFCLITVFAATSFAGTVAQGDEQSWLELLRPVYDSFKSGQYLLAGMTALLVVVALLRKYAGSIPKVGPSIAKFLATDVGGVVMTLVASFATSMSIQLANAGVSWSMTKTAAVIAVGAAGGYSMIKKLLVEPLLRPWYEKSTGIVHTVLGIALYLFTSPDPVAKAEAAGTAAVAATPPTGMGTNVKEVE